MKITRFSVSVFIITFLISFSHVRAEEINRLQASEVKIVNIEAGYKDNVYFKVSDSFRLDIYGYGQARYTYQANDITSTDDLSNFQVQRMRLGFKGYAGSEKLKYQLLLSASQSGEYDKVSLLDWFVDYSHAKELGIRAGQFKVPYSTSFTISASELQFVERTQIDSNFRLDRDNGVNIYGKVLDSKLTYNIGVYNGEGRNKSNPDNGMLYAARILFEPLGKYSYNESDIETSSKPVALASAAYAISNNQVGSTNTNLNARLATTALGISDVTGYNAFAGVKYNGASMHAEYFHRNINPDNDTKDKEKAQGYYVQAGYLIVPKTVEIAARYEYFDPNDDSSDDLRKEYGIGVNYFIKGHKNKIQADIFRIEDEAGKDGDKDNRLRVQYQLAF